MPILLSAVPDCIAWILFFRSSNSSSSTLSAPLLVGLDASELLKPLKSADSLRLKAADCWHKKNSGCLDRDSSTGEAIFSDTSYGGLLDKDVSGKRKMSWGHGWRIVWEKEKRATKASPICRCSQCTTNDDVDHPGASAMSPSMVAILMWPSLLASCGASRASLSKV